MNKKDSAAKTMTSGSTGEGGLGEVWIALRAGGGYRPLPAPPAGRRPAAGIGFLAVGYVFRGRVLGVLSMAWSALPLSAGALDLCNISALLGGPPSGAKIHSKYETGLRPDGADVPGMTLH